MPEDNHRQSEPNSIFLNKILSIKPVRAVVNFFYKFRKVFIAIVVIFAVIVIMFYLMPVISLKNTKLVNIGASVKVEPGQTVYIKGENNSVAIASFVSDVCAIPGTCFGNINEKDVEYRFIIDGTEYNVSSAIQESVNETPKYKIETESSDYKTYAIIKIVKK